MSHKRRPDIGQLKGMIGVPTPKLPNTNAWTWFCCSCSQANHRPKEDEGYSVCRVCRHERCRSCNIRWKTRTSSQEYPHHAHDHTSIYNLATYHRLKLENIYDNAKHGIRHMQNREERLKREAAKKEAEFGNGAWYGELGVDGMAGCTSEDSVSEVGEIGSMFEQLHI